MGKKQKSPPEVVLRDSQHSRDYTPTGSGTPEIVLSLLVILIEGEKEMTVWRL